MSELLKHSISRGKSILEICKYVQDNMVGTPVELLHGKYKGRSGVVADVCPDSNHGLVYLVHPYRRDGIKGVLTDHADARSYWGANQLKWPFELEE